MPYESDRSRFTLMGFCTRCFRGDWRDPPTMCGDCEKDAYEAEREAAVSAFWDELEYERDMAFEALCVAGQGANDV